MTVIKMGQLSTNNNQVPWWVNAVYKVGVPTAIAVYLVYILASKVQNNLEAVQYTVNQHISDQKNHYSNELKQLQMLRIICAQGAKNAVERNACFE